MKYFLISTFVLLYFGIDKISAVGEKSLASSVFKLNEVLLLETTLIENLFDYVKLLEPKTRRPEMEAYIDALATEHNKANSNLEEYFSNPINGFQLIRRLHSDWAIWKTYMNASIGLAQIQFMDYVTPEMPTGKDFLEVLQGIYRLQEVYELKTEHIVAGVLNGKQYDAKLTLVDCYVLGVYGYHTNNSFLAAKWYYAAKTLYGLPTHSVIDKIHGINQHMIDSELKKSLFQLGKGAKQYEILKFTKFTRGLNMPTFLALDSFTNYSGIEQELSHHHKGCRGEYQIDWQTNSRLYCRYDAVAHAYLRLAPFKMELLNLEPRIAMFHDVMYEHEINQLKYPMARLMKRSTVGDGVIHEHRVSKSFGLPDHFSPLVQRLLKRLADLTGFDVFHSELLEVKNYGVAGHYGTHVDYYGFDDEERFQQNKQISMTNRLATVLFYLSDVEVGGATVFPELNLTVYPKKRSALLFYNLNNAGNGDPSSKHAACPVLFGSKWVASKWIADSPQMFRKLCPRSGDKGKDHAQLGSLINT